MNELVINSISNNKGSLIASVYLVKGKIGLNEEWQYKYNPKIKMMIKEPVTMENSNEFLTYYLIENTALELKFFDKPTSWIKKIK